MSASHFHFHTPETAFTMVVLDPSYHRDPIAGAVRWDAVEVDGRVNANWKRIGASESSCLLKAGLLSRTSANKICLSYLDSFKKVFQKRERGRGAICHPTDLPNFATIVVTTMSARVKDTRAFTIQEKILRAAHMRKLVRPLRSHHP